jgi:hypothetical protein
MGTKIIENRNEFISALNELCEISKIDKKSNNVANIIISAIVVIILVSIFFNTRNAILKIISGCLTAGVIIISVMVSSGTVRLNEQMDKKAASQKKRGSFFIGFALFILLLRVIMAIIDFIQ